MFTIPNFRYCTPPSPAGSRRLARKAASDGFSLIEVLISTVILLVIVVMVSMVFQQQSAAYQSGTDRVQGQAALRNAVGMIVRDLSLAVSNSYGITESKVSFSAENIQFLAETGQAGRNASGEELKGATAVQLISYTKTGNAVQRKILGTLVAKDGKFELESETGHTVTISGINGIKFTFSDSTKFPASVTIHAEHEGRSSAASIVGWSAGPDCEWGTDDDIYVGGKP